MEIQLCKIYANFPLDLRHYCMQPTAVYAMMAIMTRIKQEMCMKCAQLFHITDRIKINKENKSIATGPSTCTYTSNLKRFERSYLKMWKF